MNLLKYKQNFEVFLIYKIYKCTWDKIQATLKLLDSMNSIY